MESVARMIRQGARGLARTPAFSFSVILLLGVGVGSVSAIFAVVDHVLVRPLPYPEVDRLVVIEGGPHSFPAVRDLQAMRSIEAWAAAWADNVSLTGQGEPRRVRQADSSRCSAGGPPLDACCSRRTRNSRTRRCSPTVRGSECSALTAA
jgi:hypothetical protein